MHTSMTMEKNFFVTIDQGGGILRITPGARPCSQRYTFIDGIAYCVPQGIIIAQLQHNSTQGGDWLGLGLSQGSYGVQCGYPNAGLVTRAIDHLTLQLCDHHCH